VLVRLDRLSKSYNEAGQNRIVLNQVSQEFYEDEFVCVLGKSGSGKSTLLNLISGIDAPNSGHVFIREGEQEIDLTRLNEHQRTLFRRRHIGIIFQFFNLIPTLTVLENVILPLELARASDSRKDGQTRAETLLDQVGLGDRFNTYPDKLSGGEQQRVAIARALVHNPLMLLADEPTGNLDTEIGETVMSLLLKMIRGTGKMLLMATHASEIVNRADRVLHITDGVLVNDTGT
jgi:putative ABC transport system ATP-binding protein